MEKSIGFSHREWSKPLDQRSQTIDQHEWMQGISCGELVFMTNWGEINIVANAKALELAIAWKKNKNKIIM